MEIDHHNGLSLQWRLFRVANYLLIACILGFTGLVLYSIAGGDELWNEFVLIFAGAAVLLINFCSNIYLLEKFYPHREISSTYRRLMGLTLFFSGFIIAFLTIGFVYLLNEVLTENAPVDRYAIRRRIIMAVFGTILLTMYYVTWQQVALRKTIDRNTRRLYNAFLENDKTSS